MARLKGFRFFKILDVCDRVFARVFGRGHVYGQAYP